MTHIPSPSDGPCSARTIAFNGRTHVRSNVERSVRPFSPDGAIADRSIVPANLLQVTVVVDDETVGRILGHCSLSDQTILESQCVAPNSYSNTQNAYKDSAEEISTVNHINKYM